MRHTASHPSLAVALGALALALWAPRAVAADDITGTFHDMTSNLANGSALMRLEMNNYGEICVYCHTPHNANNDYAGAPLWNRSTTTATFTMYSSSSIDTTIATSPNSYSLICLSCHDGSIAVDAIVNAPGSGANLSGPWYGKTASPLHYNLKAGSGNCGECHDGGVAHNQDNVYIGEDLSDDHPVSMTYPTASQDPMFNTPPDLNAGWPDVRLFYGKVECPTCHNPHDATYRPFLRMSNSQSQLCLTCHIK